MLFFLGVVFIITEIRLLDNPSTFAAGKSSKTRWGFRFPQTPKTTAPRGSWTRRQKNQKRPGGPIPPGAP